MLERIFDLLVRQQTLEYFDEDAGKTVYTDGLTKAKSTTSSQRKTKWTSSPTAYRESLQIYPFKMKEQPFHFERIMM